MKDVDMLKYIYFRSVRTNASIERITEDLRYYYNNASNRYFKDVAKGLLDNLEDDNYYPLKFQNALKDCLKGYINV